MTSVTIIGIDEEGNEQTLMEEQEVTPQTIWRYSHLRRRTFRAVRFELTGTGAMAPQPRSMRRAMSSR
ncbi:MAG: hypothetical protein ACLVJ6_17530 [Merdibacter sp.]